MEPRLKSAKINLDNLYKQQENAKIELAEPFAYEQELAEKSERLTLLNIALNIDDGRQESVLMDDDDSDTDEEIEVDEVEAAKNSPSLGRSDKTSTDITK